MSTETNYYNNSLVLLDQDSLSETTVVDGGRPRGNLLTRLPILGGLVDRVNCCAGTYAMQQMISENGDVEDQESASRPQGGGGGGVLMALPSCSGPAVTPIAEDDKEDSRQQQQQPPQGHGRKPSAARLRDFYASEGIHRQGSWAVLSDTEEAMPPPLCTTNGQDPFIQVIDRSDTSVSTMTASLRRHVYSCGASTACKSIPSTSIGHITLDAAREQHVGMMFVPFGGRDDDDENDDENAQSTLSNETTSTTTTVPMSARSSRRYHDGGGGGEDSSIETNSTTALSWKQHCEDVIALKAKEQAMEQQQFLREEEHLRQQLERRHVQQDDDEHDDPPAVIRQLSSASSSSQHQQPTRKKLGFFQKMIRKNSGAAPAAPPPSSTSLKTRSPSPMWFGGGAAAATNPRSKAGHNKSSIIAPREINIPTPTWKSNKAPNPDLFIMSYRDDDHDDDDASPPPGACRISDASSSSHNNSPVSRNMDKDFVDFHTNDDDNDDDDDCWNVMLDDAREDEEGYEPLTSKRGDFRVLNYSPLPFMMMMEEPINNTSKQHPSSSSRRYPQRFLV